MKPFDVKVIVVSDNMAPNPILFLSKSPAFIQC
jgi:hypothetical protein